MDSCRSSGSGIEEAVAVVQVEVASEALEQMLDVAIFDLLVVSW
jgi:hypothetical protein